MNGFVWNLLIMSLEATLTGCAVLLLRFAFRRLPKSYACVLWLLVLFRLLCPVTVTSRFSLMPDGQTAAQLSQAAPFRDGAASPEAGASFRQPETALSAAPAGREKGLAPDTPGAAPEAGGRRNALSGLTGNIRPRIAALWEASPLAAGAAALAAFWQTGGDVLSLLWLAGAIALAAAYLIEYAGWRRRIRGCECRPLTERLPANVLRRLAPRAIWLAESEQVPEPCVCGILRPVIYLPAGMTREERDHILFHEQMHIRHQDPLLRLLWQLALILHWFNPFVWLALSLLQKDMEMYCDESVLRFCDIPRRQDYALTLLRFSLQKSGLPFPLTFGESNTESRIRHILKWKKPALAVSVLAVLAILLTGLFFLTDPGSGDLPGGTDRPDAAQNADGPETEPEGDESAAAAPASDDPAAGTKAPEDPAAANGPGGGAEAGNLPDDPEAGQTGSDPAAGSAQTDMQADAPDRADLLLALGQRWASALVRRDNAALIPLLSEGELLDQLRQMEADGTSIGWSSPWPWFEDYRLNYAGARDEIAITYYAYTSDPHIYAWREVLTLARTEDGYLVADSDLQTDAVASSSAFRERYHYESSQDYRLSGAGYRFRDTPLDCFASNEGTEALGVSCMADWYLQQEAAGNPPAALLAPETAAAWFLDLEGGTAETLESPWADRVCLRWRFADGPTDVICLCPMDAQAGAGTSSRLWAVEDILEESLYQEELEKARLIARFLEDPSLLPQSGPEGEEGIRLALAGENADAAVQAALRRKPAGQRRFCGMERGKRQL